MTIAGWGIPEPSEIFAGLRRMLFGNQRQTIRELAALKDAICSDAAYLAQGSSYSYLRARSGTHADRMFRDPDFAAALNRCKWEAFAAAAADLLLLVEIELRPHHQLPPGFLSTVLAQLYEETLALEQTPEHRRSEGWTADVRLFRARAEAALRAAPAPLRQICGNTGKRLMQFAPITDDVRKGDWDMVTNNVEFRFIERLSAMRRIMDGPTLCRRLAARCSQVAAAEV